MRFKIDWFMVAIFASAAVASVLPAEGIAVGIVHWATVAAIAALFYLYGVRLEPRDAWKGLTHWRLHLTILSMTFVVFPIIGVSLSTALTTIIPAGLAAGILYTSLVPSTVQSSIAFTSIAKGNVAGAIVSASASNLIGVLLTPILAMLLMRSEGSGAIQLDTIGKISAQILLPFVLGQLTRRWTFNFVKRHPKLKLFDQGSIVLVVYAAFSEGVREGIWAKISAGDLGIVILTCATVLAFMLWFTHFVAKHLHFNWQDQIAIQFCGTKKSLATGLPMALVLFPAKDLGMIMIPLMCFHMMQLMACSVLASRYHRMDTPETMSI